MNQHNRLDKNQSWDKAYHIFSVVAVVIIAILSAVQFKLGEEK